MARVSMVALALFALSHRKGALSTVLNRLVEPLQDPRMREAGRAVRDRLTEASTTAENVIESYAAAMDRAKRRHCGTVNYDPDAVAAIDATARQAMTSAAAANGHSRPLPHELAAAAPMICRPDRG